MSAPYIQQKRLNNLIRSKTTLPFEKQEYSGILERLVTSEITEMEISETLKRIGGDGD